MSLMPPWGDKNFASKIAYVIPEIRFFVAMQPTVLIKQVTDQCRKCIYIQGYFGIFACLTYIELVTTRLVSICLSTHSTVWECVVQIALCPAEPVVWLNSDSGHCFSDGFFSHDNDFHLVPVSQLVHSERAMQWNLTLRGLWQHPFYVASVVPLYVDRFVCCLLPCRQINSLLIESVELFVTLPAMVA